MLNKLGKNLKVSYMTNETFPVGKAELTPPEDCCKGPNHKCPISEAAWSADVWKALEFSVDQEHMFRYSYESDGKTATATAVGDLDCDGTSITYKLEMSGGPDGATMNIVPPAPDSD
jgi:hypothetical protein